MIDCPECGEYIPFDDVSTSDLLEELEERMTRRDAQNIWGSKEINEWIVENYPLKHSLLDQQKNELFEEARGRFTIAELTERLKP